MSPPKKPPPLRVVDAYRDPAPTRLEEEIERLEEELSELTRETEKLLEAYERVSAERNKRLASHLFLLGAFAAHAAFWWLTEGPRAAAIATALTLTGFSALKAFSAWSDR